jgi:DNA-binding NarL/FixJ family response regulator
MKPHRPRILLADDHALLLDAFRGLLESAYDHALLLDAFRGLLESAYDVVGCVTDGRAMMEAATRLEPDIVIADISMPLLNGLDACQQLTARLPQAKVIILTMDEDPDVAAEAFRRGAAGFALKKSASSELLEALEAVSQGNTYVSAAITDLPPSTFAALARDSATPPPLTTRQREVLQLLAEGMSMKKAADILKVTPRTIAFHKYTIMDRHGLKSNAELVRFAVGMGLVKD